MYLRMWMNVLSASCACLVGLTFVLAGLTKILKPKPFVSALIGYKILPVALISPAAVGLPIVECSLGLALLLVGRSRAVAAMCGLLLLIFAGAMAANLLRGRGNTPCGCGVIGKRTVSWSLVFRNIAFAGIAFGRTPGGLKIAGMSITIALAAEAVFRRRRERPGALAPRLPSPA